MNWLAKINLTVVVNRLGSFKSALLLLATIALCLYCGYRVGNYYEGYQQQTIIQQNTRLDSLYSQHNDLLKRVHTLELELDVERFANQKAQQTIKEIEMQHFAAKKELAFYQKVMAPEKQANGLIIDELIIIPTTSANHYRFTVVLVQQKVNKRYAKGYIKLNFVGSQQQKPASIRLTDISTLTQKDLSFSLKYFQHISGEFTLPDGFVPEAINIATILPKGRWQKANQLSQTFDWQDVL